VAQCHEADPGLTAQYRTVAGMASPGGWRKSAGYDSQARQRNDVRGFVFDLGAYMCQSIKCPIQGSSYGGGEPVGASSEAETRPRG
jgi:hypothetical protein